jgi:hypothetical protein
MTYSPKQTLTRWWIGILAIILIDAHFLPSTAQASCGDYLSYRQETSSEHFKTFPSSKEPCHGPSCSNGGSKPLLPPVQKIPRNHLDEGIVLTDELSATHFDPFNHYLWSDEFGNAIYRPFRIDPPPRLGSSNIENCP